jgi:hypothetical protein
MNPKSYFVLADDGQRYGPVDVPTLNQWVQDGRIARHTTLEDAETGVQMSAPAISGLMLPQPVSRSFFDDNYIQLGWASAVLAILLGLSGTYLAMLAGALGILWSIRAREAKYPHANLMIALNVLGSAVFWLGHLFSWSLLGWIFGRFFH